MYGRAVILATRYEEVRKILTQTMDIQGSMIILQSQVFRSLPSSLRKDFIELDLSAQGLNVRDDPSATSLFYSIVNRLAAQKQRRAS
jgi:hypothetical protein